MTEKIHNSAFFLTLIILLVYAVCWIACGIFLDKMSLFSMNHPAHSLKLQLLAGFLYLSVSTFFIFILMKLQVRHAARLRSKLEIADETLESRVKLRTAEIEKLFGELKTLKGIIPICAHCKSIRNGSGRWEKIEVYIQKHSEAQFSHGLCPECERELYGDKRLHFKTIAHKYS